MNPWEIAGVLSEKYCSPDDLERKSRIGGGGEGVVYEVQQKEDVDAFPKDTVLAMKEESLDGDIYQKIVFFFREVFNQVYGSHPAVLPILGWGLKIENEKLGVAIIMKKMEGTLSAMHYKPPDESARFYRGQYALCQPGTEIVLTPTNRSIIAYGIARGMAHLHRLGIFHRDLKCQNVLLDEKKWPYIADLGMSKITCKNVEQSGTRGTAANWAPEVWMHGYKCQYSFPADVYAFATIAYDLWTETNFRREMGTMNLDLLGRRIWGGARPPIRNATKAQEKLLDEMWHQGAEKRPTFEEIANLLEREEYWVEGTDANEFRAYVAEVNGAEKWTTPIMNISAWMNEAPEGQRSISEIKEQANREDGIAQYILSLLAACGKGGDVSAPVLTTLLGNMRMPYADLLVRTFKTGTPSERGAYYQAMGDLDTAMKHYEEGALNGDIGATARLGAINLATGHTEQGLKLLELAASLCDAMAVYTLIEYHNSTNNDEEVEKWLNFAKDKELKDVVDQWNLMVKSRKEMEEARTMEYDNQ